LAHLYAHSFGRLAGVVLTAAALMGPDDGEQSAAPATRGVTMIDGVAVGHFTLAERPTGCTVVLAPPGSIGAVDVRGGSPGTRETDLLAPDNVVQNVHALVFAGGSAFGLDAASGVMRFLAEKKIGYETSAGPVPIVPAAILFDLNVGGRPDIRPDAACGYEAARRATTTFEEGSVGAGAGATVGKLLGPSRAMKGGVGTAAASLPDGVNVAALVIVNAVGTVVDPRTGRAIAGVRTADGRALEDPFALVRRGAVPIGPGREHTTIGVVLTNARLTKAQAHTVAKMAQDGIARAIVPSHTSQDGDTLFTLATGAVGRDANASAIGALAADLVAEAIGRAVTTARGLPGFPSASDLRSP
jgi:L-aminopeptidase/D-esterase-like protein